MPGFHALGAAPLTSLAGAVEVIESMSDASNATDSLTALLAGGLRDSASASDTMTTYAEYYAQLLAEAEASDVLRAVIAEVLADNANATEALASIFTHYEQLLDTVLASDSQLSQLTASNALFTVAVAAELLRQVEQGSLVSSATAGIVLANAMEAVAAMVAAATASDSLGNTLRMVTYLEAEAAASQSLGSFAELVGLLDSGAAASVVFTIGDEQYTAWVLNTENIAVTQYSNYPFNSFAEMDGVYCGAASDGLYELTGDTDNGTAIQAYLRAPLTDFGFASLKRLDQVYLGYTASGDMVFKAVVISPNGVKDEHWYRLEPRPAESVGGTRETRVPVGKGLKSVYWQWELHNIDGAQFELETVRLWPMGLSRRVR